MKNLLVLFLIILTLTPFIYAQTDFAYNRLYDDAQPTVSNVSSGGGGNGTGSWNTTSLGILTDANATQFNNNSGTLSIIGSWLQSFIISIGNLNWLALDGSNDATAITLNGSTINDWSEVNITGGGGIWTNVSGVATFEGGINVTTIYNQGNIITVGNITTSLFGQFDSGIRDSSLSISIDSELRKLLDSLKVSSFDWENRLFFSSSGTTIARFNGTTISWSDNSGFTSIDIQNRLLIANDGSDTILNFSISGLAEFDDSNITTTGDVRVGNMIVVGNITLGGNVTFSTNGTCNFMHSPDGSTIFEVCNA